MQRLVCSRVGKALPSKKCLLLASTSGKQSVLSQRSQSRSNRGEEPRYIDHETVSCEAEGRPGGADLRDLKT